jgi:chromosomal replication initiator protein
MDIQTAAAAKFGVSLRELMSDRKAQRVARPRQIAMFLAKELTSRSLPVIGHAFDRDHTTVMHACRVVELRCAGDAKFAAAVAELRAVLEDSSVRDQPI